jgi:hypothetical protein
VSSRRLCLLALLWVGAAVAQGPPASAPEYDRFGSLFGRPTTHPAPRWDSDQYDPSPAAGPDLARELTLPMPCGGAMVLRRIDVDGPGLLGERAVVLGSTSAADAPLDHIHLEHLAGGLGAAGDPIGRHYYLGKYEVTDLQYRVVRGPCPQRLEGRLPAVRVSWYDAVDFTRRYTEWLNAHVPGALPEEDATRAFVRLPTEVEWEYAARGGDAVDAAAFRGNLFPMGDGSIDDYAWIRESVSSSYQPRPIGSLRPNPLGLYDMLGNAAELVLDPFRLVTSGRLHGQAGGTLVKGGHFRTWRNTLSTAWRQEHPPFDPSTGEANRLDTVGFRVAVSLPVLTSTSRVRAVRDAARRLREGEGHGARE